MPDPQRITIEIVNPLFPNTNTARIPAPTPTPAPAPNRIPAPVPVPNEQTFGKGSTAARWNKKVNPKDINLGIKRTPSAIVSPAHNTDSNVPPAGAMTYRKAARTKLRSTHGKQ